MSEQINKVLASTAQAFTTAEQKQARDNIDAQKSITYGYSGSSITAIDGSAIAQSDALTAVYHDSSLSGSGTSGSPLGLSEIPLVTVNHDSNLSGSGTSASPLGLASEITLSSTALPYTNTINTYSIIMNDQSSTSYVGLGYSYFRDSSGAETYIYTDHINISDSGTCTLTATPTGVQFFDGNNLDRFASYGLNGSVMSASGVSPTTSMLKDKNLTFHYDVGGNLESTTYMANGFSATTYTPTGTNQDTGVIAIHGISGVNSFGDYKIWDSWNSSKRAQISANGDEKSVIDMFIGYNNGSQELYPAYIGFYNPYDGSSFIYQSSIVAWNNNLSAEHPVSAGNGLSGNGTSGSPLCVTGILNEYTSIYSTSCFSSDRTALDILTDEYSAKLHYGGVWFDYGGSVFHSARTELRPSEFVMRDYTDDNSVLLNASSIKLYYNLNDSTASASADINARTLSSLFAWALNNGWTP